MLVLVGCTSTTWPTSSAETLPEVSPVSSSITWAAPVANSWPLTNTLPNAVMAPDEVGDVELGLALPPFELSLPPPPPQAASASTSATGKAWER